jgi:hypothetical protein
MSSCRPPNPPTPDVNTSPSSPNHQQHATCGWDANNPSNNVFCNLTTVYLPEMIDLIPPEALTFFAADKQPDKPPAAAARHSSSKGGGKGKGRAGAGHRGEQSGQAQSSSAGRSAGAQAHESPVMPAPQSQQHPGGHAGGWLTRMQACRFLCWRPGEFCMLAGVPSTGDIKSLPTPTQLSKVRLDTGFIGATSAKMLVLADSQVV